jgi:hypothetical protein
MRRAGTNAPVGANYNKAFGLWLDEHQWARELAATRSRQSRLRKSRLAKRLHPRPQIEDGGCGLAIWPPAPLERPSNCRRAQAMTGFDLVHKRWIVDCFVDRNG